MLGEVGVIGVFDLAMKRLVGILAASVRVGRDPRSASSSNFLPIHTLEFMQLGVGRERGSSDWISAALLGNQDLVPVSQLCAHCRHFWNCASSWELCVSAFQINM